MTAFGNHDLFHTQFNCAVKDTLEEHFGALSIAFVEAKVDHFAGMRAECPFFASRIQNFGDGSDIFREFHYLDGAEDHQSIGAFNIHGQVYFPFIRDPFHTAFINVIGNAQRAAFFNLFVDGCHKICRNDARI